MSRVRHLAVLGLGEEATLAEIEQAFKFMCQAFYPDKFPEKWRQLASEKMIAIIAAREALKNYSPRTQTSQNQEQKAKQATAPVGRKWKPTYSPGIQLCNGIRCRELFIQADEPVILVKEGVYFHPWCFH